WSPRRIVASALTTTAVPFSVNERALTSRLSTTPVASTALVGVVCSCASSVAADPLTVTATCTLSFAATTPIGTIAWTPADANVSGTSDAGTFDSVKLPEPSADALTDVFCTPTITEDAGPD